MHILLVTFQLEGMSDAAYQAYVDGISPAVAGIPGLISKVWLADPETGVYGGIYTFEDEAACQRYMLPALFTAFGAPPQAVNVRSQDFAVAEGPTKVTRGLAAGRHARPWPWTGASSAAPLAGIARA